MINSHIQNKLRLTELFFIFEKFFGFPDFIFCGIYLPEWALSFVSEVLSDVC